MSSISQDHDVRIVGLITAHQADLAAYINSLLPGDSSAADVLQRTNLVLWKKRDKFEIGTDFLAWGFSVARWEVKSLLKEQKRRSWLVVDEDLTRLVTDAAVEEAKEMPMSELRDALERCIAKLKPGEKELVTHRYYTDETLSDYAKNQGRPVTSLKTSLARIRSSLKRCIESIVLIESITEGGKE